MSTTARKLDLTELEEIAFPPDHPVTLVDLRAFAYAHKAGETPEPRIVEHVEGCHHCERQLSFLRTADPILNGQEDKLTAALLELAQSPERQQRAEDRARNAAVAATASLGTFVRAAAAAYQAVAGRNKV